MAQVSSMCDKLSCRETVAEKISEQAHLQSFKRNHLKKKKLHQDYLLCYALFGVYKAAVIDRNCREGKFEGRKHGRNRRTAGNWKTLKRKQQVHICLVRERVTTTGDASRSIQDNAGRSKSASGEKDKKRANRLREEEEEKDQRRTRGESSRDAGSERKEETTQ